MPAAKNDSSLLLNVHQAAALAALVMASSILLLCWAMLEASAAPLDESHRQAARLNLNTATAAELQLVPGIGDSLAERILDLRRQRDGFRSVDELLDVRGIGEIRLRQMRPHIIVE